MPKNKFETSRLPDPRFECLGTPVYADETRSAAVCRNSTGSERIVIAARGYVLVVEPNSGYCRQVPFPDGFVDYPFASIGASSGQYYVGAGRKFMRFDPFAETFVQQDEPMPDEEIIGLAFAEDYHGTIYATTYPGCYLIAFRGDRGGCNTVARLHEEQKYATTLTADRKGWIYAGIGTESGLIAAYDPVSQHIFYWPDQHMRTRGTGYVHTGTDGEVYGCLQPTGVTDGSGAVSWYRLREGKMTPVSADEVAPSSYIGEGYQKLHGCLQGGRTITAWSLGDRELIILEPDGQRRFIPLNYQGNGAELSPLVEGPDGQIYGTSNHPLHFFRYDPNRNEFDHFGSKAIEFGGGGNICAYAVSGTHLFGAAYAGGFLHTFDTSRPVNTDSSSRRNPRLLTAHEEIHRPRCAIAHPDGEHVIYGGFPGYGAVGGSLCIFHATSGQSRLIPHTEIVPEQSTLCLAMARNGDVMGGTSIETPGGAVPQADEAMLYRMHWPSRKIVERWIPIPGAREISLLVLDEQEHIHALTSDSIYFVFDPANGKLVHQQNLSAWGGIVRHGLVHKKDGTGRSMIYGLLSNAIFKADPEKIEVKLLAQPPQTITSGMAVIVGAVYFGSGSKLWQYRID